MRPDRVAEGEEFLNVLDQVLPVGDLVPVEMFVLQRLVEPLDDAVGLRGVVAGSDVDEFGPGRDELGEGRALVATCATEVSGRGLVIGSA